MLEKLSYVTIFSFSDIFQKLSSVLGQQEWLIACGAHKVSLLTQVKLKIVHTHSTVKPVLSGHSKIDKTKALMANGSLMKVPLEHSAILLTCIKRYSVLKTNFWSSLFEWPLKTGFTVFSFENLSTVAQLVMLDS